MIHLAHDLTDATVLIFGGGQVGARRARSLEEATVIVVAPTFVDADFGGAALVRAEPGPEHARTLIDRVDPALVVAATDDREFNAAAAAAGRDVGALVNRADQSADAVGTVDVPATVSEGCVTASVSTGGSSPTVSAHLRDRIADRLAGSDEVAAVAGDLRDDLRDRGLSPGRRRETLRAVVESERVWQAARGDGDARAAADGVVDGVLADIETAEDAER